MCTFLLRLSAFVILILAILPESQAQCSCTLDQESSDPLLAWIARQQRADGRWSRLVSTTGTSSKAKPTPKPQPQLDKNRDLGVTGLTLLSLMGAGTTHQVGNGRKLVRKGLLWVRKQSSPTGLISTKKGASGFADHAIATLVMCEMTRRSKSALFEPVAKAAVDQLVEQLKSCRKAEKPNKLKLEDIAFAYCALRSAKHLEFSVAPATLEWLAGSVRTDAKSSFLTLCTSAMMRALEPRSPQRLVNLTPLMERIVAHKDALTMTDPLAAYFGSIAAHQVGGKYWKRWCKLLQKPVVESLHSAFPRGTVWAASPSLFPDHVGSIALRLLTVELYYRYATVFGSDR